jgi:hypothetical protein
MDNKIDDKNRKPKGPPGFLNGLYNAKVGHRHHRRIDTLDKVRSMVPQKEKVEEKEEEEEEEDIHAFGRHSWILFWKSNKCACSESDNEATEARN